MGKVHQNFTELSAHDTIMAGYYSLTFLFLFLFIEAVLMSTHNLCFEQKYEKYQIFLSENFQFLVVKFSVYLNRHVFIME